MSTLLSATRPAADTLTLAFRLGSLQLDVPPE